MEGNRIKQGFTRVGRDLVQRYLPLPVANVSDVMSRMTAGGPRLRPMHRAGKLCGPALTVKSRPGDNLMLHKAIDLAEPGDVIVCDAGGEVTNALMGELMLAHAIRRGVGGFVLNGAIRDVEAFQTRNLPVYALGVTHRGPYKDGPGEIGFPVSLDGMVIAPGDLVLGDADGVLCVPRAEAEAILLRARGKQEAEERQMAETEAGTVDRSWIDRVLAQKACAVLD
ncbi:MAG: methyltransferase [Rhodovulum sulfidophilum]|uniref:Putative 4-hydroxy-4-methyl-2-oxoglutarate aldolase n=1 Tax=Rhodovulum sulfidophilum TaxID=35806 RepID=A0A2W5PYR9_RHOSU|nr:MAG: methyltransferase [Rhodovulum sulfidophilum]